MDNPLIKQQEKHDKIVRLEGLIKSNSDPRELKRALAVKMSIAGYSDRITAQLLGVSTSFVRDWKRAFKVRGIAGIKLGYQGAIAKLTTEQRREIIEWLKAKDYWHLDELINHLEDKYEFVKNLQRKYLNQKIVLIWDGASYHRFGEFREYLTEVNQSKSTDDLEVTCILFATNAPQLLGSFSWTGNPSENESAKSS